MSQRPEDLTGRLLQTGDFCIYTLNQDGGLNFGFIEEMKTVKARYGGQGIRIKIAHADINGNRLNEREWNNAAGMYVDIPNKPKTTWLNYTYKGRFLVTKPI
jgi:hypothetical protein